MKVIFYISFLIGLGCSNLLATHSKEIKITLLCEQAMKAKDFKQQLKVIQNTQFSDTKLQLCKGLIKANCISTKQLIELLKVFSFEQHKAEIAKEAYDSVVDQSNFYKIYPLFKQEINIQEIEKYIQSK